MFSIQLVKIILVWAAIALALAAAYYWYMASIAKVTDEKSRHNPGLEMIYQDPENEGKLVRLVASAMEQSRLNKVAAIYTALSVLAQAVGLAL